MAAAYRDGRQIARAEFAPERARLFERARLLPDAARRWLPPELRHDLATLTASLAAVDAGVDPAGARRIAAAYEEALEAALAFEAPPPTPKPRPRARRFDWPVVVSTAVAVVAILILTVR
jgi:hypothetical protein